MYNEYRAEYDRCALAGYDSYTCHLRGTYAGNLEWATDNPAAPMVAPPPNFPTLTLPPPYGAAAAHIVVGGQIAKERGPPYTHPAPPPSWLPTSFAFWATTYPGPACPGNLALPPAHWTHQVGNA